MEDGIVTIGRVLRTVTFPSRFTLAGALNPCPCGFFNDARHECICSSIQIARYLAKISGPLLDRIDLQVEVPALTPEEISSTTAGESSALIRERVEAARQIQRERFRRASIQSNAEMSTRHMRRYCELGPSSRRLLQHAVARLGLSARGYDRLLKVARTIADLAACERLKKCKNPGDSFSDVILREVPEPPVETVGELLEHLKQFDGKTIAQISAAQKKAPLDTLFDFILDDKAQTGALYFIANEQDLRYGLKQPWTSLCLDASELSLDGPLFEPHSHPRAFGAMPRFLGHYVRDEHLLPLEQGIRKMTSLPAQRERLRDRGLLKQGYFADITIFDPATIGDRATYQKPTQLSEGVKYVFVNGKLEYEDGHLTGVNAGRVLRGAGWKSEH